MAIKFSRNGVVERGGFSRTSVNIFHGTRYRHRPFLSLKVGQNLGLEVKSTFMREKLVEKSREASVQFSTRWDLILISPQVYAWNGEMTALLE